jgi:hypothetical protein
MLFFITRNNSFYSSFAKSPLHLQFQVFFFEQEEHEEQQQNFGFAKISLGLQIWGQI